MGSLFDIGLSGMRASKNAMYLTGNNIANANNAFYSRREVDFIEMSSSLFGNGVNVGDVRRIVDSFANNQLVRSTQDWAKADAYYDRMSHLETFLDNTETSAIKFINESLSALETLNTTPGSMTGRNHYLTQLDSLSNRMQQINRQFKTEATETKKEIGSNIEKANSILNKLASLNEQIAMQNASSTESGAMSLLDQQDELMTKLAALIDVDHHVDEKGQLSIQLNNGLSLLLGNQVNPLVLANNGNANSINIGVMSSGTVTPVNDLFSSGTIKGLMDYYDNSISHSQHQLDLLALNIAEKINHQNQSGVDAKGALGGLVFKDINSASAASNRVSSSLTNTGNGNLTVMLNDVSNLDADEYTLTFDTSTEYTLVRKSDGVAVQTGTLTGLPDSISFGGFSVNINAGTYNQGDSFSISPTQGGASTLELQMSDGSLLALGLPVVTKEATNNSGNGVLQLTQITDITNAAFSIPKHLNPPVRIEFLTPTTYQLINDNDGTVLENNLSYDPVNGSDLFPTPSGYDPGYRLQLSGTIQAGDSFSTSYNSDGLGDNRNGLLLAQLYLGDQDTLGFSQLYQNLIMDVTTASNEAKINLDSTAILKDQAQVRRDATSAVSLEEETMNLARYQESYMASAQVLDAVKQTMDVIFALLRN